MVIVHKDLRRKKPSGGRFKKARAKRKFEKGNLPILTSIGKKVVKIFRTKGGGRKLKLKSTELVNAFDKKNKKFVKAKLVRVIDNPANRNFIRGNIITKGAIVETDKGNVKITNRPGQDGVLNGVII